MLNLPTEIIEAKNKLYSDKHFFELLEIQMLDGNIERIVNNNADVPWGGHIWTKFRFAGGDNQENMDGEDNSVVILASNVTGVMQGYLESSSNGMIGDTIIYRLVYEDSNTAAIEGHFEIVDAQANTEWVSFTAGAESWFLNRFPAHVYRRNVCRYWPYQTDICPYTNNEICDRKFATCISLGHASDFGGQPGIPGGAFDV
jgi:phage-related protein